VGHEAKRREPDPEELARILRKVAEQSQRLVQAFLERQLSGQAKEAYNVLDPGVIVRAYQELGLRMMANPAALIEAQMRFWQGYAALVGATGRRLLGEPAEPVTQPAPGDRRFKDEAWRENPIFDFIKQSYLLASQYLLDNVRSVEGLDPKTAHKVDFYTRQFVDAVAPTNFVLTNPQVLRRTMDTGGQNLVKGLSNLLDDLERGRGRLRIRMTDLEKFELGVNIAVTPGKVVYENDLMQLIQYRPTTELAHRRPLLVVPPWINKYYILDLRPDNSFIRWAVDQGHTVFVISWVNPDAALADKSFDDYLLEGPLAALDAIEQATGEREVNAVGYCLGGTLLACALAWLTHRGDERVRAATFLTTMTDFAEPGELGVFIDEEQLALMDRAMAEKGYFEGAAMADAFNLLRANDLIWSFVVNNYLLGEEPFPFDLLYWNSDSTRMPRAMHSFYLRRMYQENRLREPGGIALAGVPIDLGAVRTPAYVFATREDHIAPWRSAYATTRLLGGPVRFVLGMSGHIAGVVNPPPPGKYGYWTGTEHPPEPERWFAAAEEHRGSWWLDWNAWLAPHHGDPVPARVPGEGGLAAIEDAPGRYVRVRA